MNMRKPNTSIRVAIFNSFESRGKLTTAAEVDDLVAHVRDAISQVFTIAMLKDRSDEAIQFFGTSFGLGAFKRNINQLICDSLQAVFDDLVKSDKPKKPDEDTDSGAMSF